MAPGTAPRAAALEILRAVRTGHRFEHALDQSVTDLSGADRRLAHTIAAGVLRERTALDHRIANLLTHPDRPLPDDLQDLLRIGVFQLTRLDRVPPYAAVQSTVELAKDRCGQRYGRLVNALLRKVNAEPPATGQGAPGDLAERHSHPTWLVERWRRRFGSGQTEALLAHNNRPPDLVLQPVRWTRDRLHDALDRAGVLVGPADPGFVVRAASVRALPGYAEGGFIVQDATQRRLLAHVAPPEGVTIWDACAAPGGKAAVLAQTHRVIASDRDARRIGRLRDTLGRVAPDVPILRADATRPPFGPAALGAVLIDAPCSATGTLARHPDGRWRLSPERLAALALGQAVILDAAAEVIHPGDGILAYLTCSLEPEENGAQVDQFLTRHPDFRRDADDLFIFPAGGNGGGFAARLRRS